jgi:predicted chitinase
MEQGSSIAEDMKQSIEELQQIYHVEYYDFSQDPEITDQPELFYNSDHLGDCGKKVFSEKLLQAMNGNLE